MEALLVVLAMIGLAGVALLAMVIRELRLLRRAVLQPRLLDFPSMPPLPSSSLIRRR